MIKLLLTNVALVIVHADFCSTDFIVVTFYTACTCKIVT